MGLPRWYQWLQQPAQHAGVRDLVVAQLGAAAQPTGYRLWCAMMKAGAANMALRLATPGQAPPDDWLQAPPAPPPAPLVLMPMLVQRHLAIPDAGDDELA